MNTFEKIGDLLADNTLQIKSDEDTISEINELIKDPCLLPHIAEAMKDISVQLSFDLITREKALAEFLDIYCEEKYYKDL